jgi:hypothetical protein
MTRAIATTAWLAALLALAACEGTKFRIVNPHPPGTPAWQYDDAFYGFLRDHDLFQRLQGTPPGQQQAAAESMITNLGTMRDLLDEPFRADLLPLIESHRRIKTDQIDGGSANAGTFMSMDELRRKVDAGFYPEKVKIKGATAESKAAAPAVPPAPAGASPAAAAWRKAHDDLAAAYPDRHADAAVAYGRAREALSILAAGAAEDTAHSLQIYLREYERLAGMTANFTKRIEGETAVDVKKALATVAKGVEAFTAK